MRVIFSIVIIRLIFCCDVLAQKNNFFDDFTIGASINYLRLNEDLTGGNSNFDNTDFGIGFYLAKQLNPIIEIRSDVLLGTITASSDHFYSSTEFKQVAGNARFYVSNLAQYNKKQRYFSLYGSLGIGFVSYKSILRDRKTHVELMAAKDRVNVVFPLSCGIELRLSERWNMDLNASVNFLRTDNFDGYRRGVDFDYYGTLGVGISYNIGKSKHVKWNNTFAPIISKVDNNEHEISDLQKRLDEQQIIISDIHKKIKTVKKNVVDQEGLDRDNDGVSDMFDEEPNTPEGSLVNFQGISLKQADVSIFMPSIYFGINSFKVRHVYYEDLASIAKVMQENSSIKLKLIGYADSTGDLNYNQKIAMKRAIAVKYVFTNIFGIDANRLFVDVGEENKFETFSEGQYDKPNDYQRRVDIRMQ